MKKRIFFSLIILLGLFSGINAQKRTSGELIQLAKQRLSSQNVNLLESNAQLSVYGNDNGFVILSRNKQSNPVIGFSKTKYDKERMPDGLKWWMKVAERALQHADNMGRMQTSSTFEVVEPFITTTWDQEKPYNYLCPSNCYAGCVATTMAQAMKYYQYPASAKGDGVYVYNKEEVKKSFSSTYNWTAMKDSYGATDGQFSTPVRAVATLMRDCGYSVHMNYSESGSGTNDIYMALALKEVFKYDSLAIKYYDHGVYSNEEWQDLVYAALAQKMPVLYAGTDEGATSGHEFLLCGTNAEGQVYVNWGWSGSGDGFYNLDMLNYFGSDFNYYQSMVTGLKPHEGPDASDKYESMWIADTFDFSVLNDDVLQLSIAYLYNYSLLDFNGTVDLTLVNKANPSNVTYLNILDTKEKELDTMKPFWGFYLVDEETEAVEPIEISGLKDLTPGIYRMSLTSKEERDEQRQYVRNPSGIQYATLKKLDNGQILVSNEDVDDISTGILSISQQTPVPGMYTPVYNLKGQKVKVNANNSKKDIYIINGKKMVR